MLHLCEHLGGSSMNDANMNGAFGRSFSGEKQLINRGRTDKNLKAKDEPRFNLLNRGSSFAPTHLKKKKIVKNKRIAARFLIDFFQKVDATIQ